MSENWIRILNVKEVSQDVFLKFKYVICVTAFQHFELVLAVKMLYSLRVTEK